MQITRRNPYPLPIRQLVVFFHVQRGMSAAQIANALEGRPCERTVDSILAQFNRDGEVLPLEGRTSVTHENRKLDEAAATCLADIMCRADQLLHEVAAEMIQRTGVEWHDWDVCGALHELGFVRKKTTKHAAEADPNKQAAFIQLIDSLGVGPKHLVFVDEVAADSRSTNRQYVWSLRGLKTAAEGVFVRGQRFTSIAAMSADGFVGDPLIMCGAANMQDFLAWFESEVFPALGEYPAEPHCVVVMDNCAIHHKPEIEKLCSIAGAIAVWLPPYSPNFNPIELLFSKVKQFLKSNRDMIKNIAPVLAIQMAFDSVSPSDCEAWIRHVGCYNTTF